MNVMCERLEKNNVKWMSPPSIICTKFYVIGHVISQKINKGKNLKNKFVILTKFYKLIDDAVN